MQEAVLVILGSSASVPTKRRWLPSIALIVEGDVYLLDCGEGTQIRLMEAGISPMKVKGVFITHKHGDHVLGLPGLIQTMTMMNRTAELTVVAPREVLELVEEVLRLTGSTPRFDLKLVEAREGVAFKCNQFTLYCFKVEHQCEAYGYVIRGVDKPGRFNPDRAEALGVPKGPLWKRLQSGHPVALDDGRVVTPDMVMGPPRKGLKIVYTGDTRPCRSVVEASKGADVLIHDSTYSEEHADKAKETGHSTASEAARVAVEAGVSLLILTHISARYKEAERLFHEAERLFRPVIIAEDLMRVRLRRLEDGSVFWHLPLP